MYDRYHAEDSAAGLLERRWFAASRAATEVQSECDALARALDQVHCAWRGARQQLLRLEALRDALGEEIAADDIGDGRQATAARRRSAA